MLKKKEARCGKDLCFILKMVNVSKSTGGKYRRNSKEKYRGNQENVREFEGVLWLCCRSQIFDMRGKVYEKICTTVDLHSS